MAFDDSSERHRAALERNLENKSRMAFSSHRFDVTGTGFTEFPDSAQFGLAYVSQPYVAIGYVIDSDEIRRVFSLGDDDPLPIPAITAAVTDWDLNERGFYVGAWCACNVSWPDTPPPELENFTFQVDFTWRGIGIKDVDPEVRS